MEGSSNNDFKKLIQHIDEGNVSEVENLLNNHPNFINEKHYNPKKGQEKEYSYLLHYTILMNKQNANAIVDLLIKKGADINAQDYLGNTALHLAIVLNHEEMIDCLLAHKPNLNIQNNKSKTASDLRDIFNKIVLYVQNNNIPKLKYLLDQYPEMLDGKVTEGTLLDLANHNNTFEAVLCLLSKGADIRKSKDREKILSQVKPDEWGQLLKKYSSSKEIKAIFFKKLTECIDKNNITMFKLLLTQNTHIINDIITFECFPNASLLNYAVITKAKDIVEFLIEQGADINIQDDQGNTPLHDAVQNKNEAMIALLIQKGADKTIKNAEKKTAYEMQKEIKREISEVQSQDLNLRTRISKWLTSKGIDIAQDVSIEYRDGQYHPSVKPNEIEFTITAKEGKKEKLINILPKREDILGCESIEVKENKILITLSKQQIHREVQTTAESSNREEEAKNTGEWVDKVSKIEPHLLPKIRRKQNPSDKKEGRDAASSQDQGPKMSL